MQNWDQANLSHTAVPFEREYLINHEPGTNIHKQFVGGFLLPNRVPVYLRSFGILNLTLWDDVIAEFLPLTSQDIIIAGEHKTCILSCTPGSHPAHACMDVKQSASRFAVSDSAVIV